MYYIYYMGQWVGTSDTWVDLPPGYELSTDPPPPPPERPPDLPPPPPPVRPTLTEDDITWCVSQLPDSVKDLGELCLRLFSGDNAGYDAVITRIKRHGATE